MQTTSKRVIAVIQARTGSSRLPNKVLADIGGRPMLAHVVERTARARHVSKVVVATSTAAGDDAIEALGRALDFPVERGSENDVLGRLCDAARVHDAEIVVRITADCPMIDPSVIDEVIAVCLQPGVDYAANVLRYTWPNGLDVEVMPFAILERAASEAKLPVEREHVTSWIRTHSALERRSVCSGLPRQWHGARWTVDHSEDLEFAREIFTRLQPEKPHFDTADVIALLEREPALAALAHDGVMHEGYYRSFAAEPPIPPTHPTPPHAGLVIEKRHGSRLRDAEGHDYVDFDMTRGAAILGHDASVVTEAIARFTREGADSDVLRSQAESALLDLVGWADAAVLDGSDGGSLRVALRIARRYTGRETVLRAGFEFDLAQSDSVDRAVAAVPGIAAFCVTVAELELAGGVAARASLDRARAAGALVVIDERLEGLRLHRGGATRHYGIDADLVCFGAEIANGYAVEAVVGRGDVIRPHAHAAAAGQPEFNPVSLVAAIATLRRLLEPDVVDTMWDEGRKLKDGFNVLAACLGVDDLCSFEGPAACARLVFVGSSELPEGALEMLVSDECARRGVLVAGSHSLSAVHTEADGEVALRAYRAALGELAAERERTALSKEPAR